MNDFDGRGQIDSATVPGDGGELSRATYCYEAIQRVFRPRLVAHIRSVFNAIYPASGSTHLRKCFGSDWQKIVDSSKRFEASGALEATARDEFDYLGVNHFHAVASRHFEPLFPSRDDQSDEVRQEARRSILRALKDIKDLRDGMSHPVVQDFTSYDALFAMRAAERVLSVIDPVAAARVHELMDLTVLGPTQKQADDDDRGVSAETPREALERMIMALGPSEAIAALREIFSANADSLREYMPPVAEAHAAVGHALAELLKASEGASKE